MRPSSHGAAPRLRQQEVDALNPRATAITGLSAAEVAKRIEAGQANTAPEGITPSVGKIVRKNIFTLFNLINIVLFVLVVSTGEFMNATFIAVPLANTVMGIVQELKSKKTLDKLSILNAARVTVVRDGAEQTVTQDNVVLGDIVVLRAGEQICTDAEVLATDSLEVNEALLTGEQDNIFKRPGSTVMSGSFVVAGQATVCVTAVGGDSFANALTAEAKKTKKKTTPLMRTLNGIIRVLTFTIVPIGLLLFFNQYNGDNYKDALLGSTAAILGMIPQGLIVLTGVTLTVGAVKLARHKAMVQSLPSIETLARVDVLCLDKTGTITDGTLSFKRFVLREDYTKEQAGRAIAELMGALPDDNNTAAAMRATFGSKTGWRAAETIPFSSSRKWSGVYYAGEGSYVVGAPQFVFPSGREPFFKTVEKYAAAGYRVLCLAKSQHPFGANQALPGDLVCLGLLIFGDNIRPEAPDTFAFCANEGVLLKVISGDDPVTVSTIAAKAGVADADRYVDMSRVGDNADYQALVATTTVFGRVTPHQKRELIRALKANGHTTCMTGDGVNDVLAMKEADCSVAMVGGSQAARNAADFVLLSSNFASMVKVLQEGRRVINNIEGVACMYLVKTIYSTLLSLIFCFVPLTYPFTPIQMTPFDWFAVGIPSFFIAMRANYARPRGRFAANVFENSVPAALTVILDVFVVLLAGYLFDLPFIETSTMIILLIGTVGLVMLAHVCQPYSKGTIALLALCITGFILCFIVANKPLELHTLWTRNAFFYIPLIYISVHMFGYLNRAVRLLEAKWHDSNKSESTIVQP